MLASTTRPAISLGAERGDRATAQRDLAARPAAARLRAACSIARGSRSQASTARGRARPRPGRGAPSRTRHRRRRPAAGRSRQFEAHRRRRVVGGSEPLAGRLQQFADPLRVPGAWAGLRRYQPATIAAGGSGQPGTPSRAARAAGRPRAPVPASSGALRGAQTSPSGLDAHRLQWAERREGARDRPRIGLDDEPGGKDGGLANLARRGPHRPRISCARRGGPATGRGHRPRRAP